MDKYLDILSQSSRERSNEEDSKSQDESLIRILSESSLSADLKIVIDLLNLVTNPSSEYSPILKHSLLLIKKLIIMESGQILSNPDKAEIISKWFLITQEIQNKLNDNDMKIILKLGFEVYRKYNEGNKMHDYDFQETFNSKNMSLFELKNQNEGLLEENFQCLIDNYIDEKKNIFKRSYSSLLFPYYEFIKEENELKRALKLSSMPSYEESKSVKEKRADSDFLKNNEISVIYQIFRETINPASFTLEKARKILDLLDNSAFMDEQKPKYETNMLIEKFKNNIYHHLSNLKSIDEITQWLLIAEEIRNKWKDIDMLALMKLGCNAFMNYNLGAKINDYRILTILNIFIGDQAEYQGKLGDESLEWILWADNKIRNLVNALKKNGFKFKREQKGGLEKNQKEHNSSILDANRKTKLYKIRIKNWLENGDPSKLKIIDIEEILSKRKIECANSSKVALYECLYRNEKAFIKAYTYKQSDQSNMKSILNEIVNSIYLSKYNKRNIFPNFYGLYLEEDNENNQGAENIEKCYVLNLVMEWCFGTLGKYINEFNPDENILNNFVDSIFHGFLWLHKYEMAHIIIRPDIILFKEIEGKIILKIADYGISSTISSNQEGLSTNILAALSESINFLAPEMRDLINNKIEGIEINRKSADIYSIGLLFFYLASSELPPEGDIDQENYIKSQMENIKIPWLKLLLENMMDKDPRKRKKIGKLIKLKTKLDNKKLQIMIYK